MSPLASAAAWSSSNQLPASLSTTLLKLLRARSIGPRKATFMTRPVELIALAAWMRQWVPAGSGIEPEMVLPFVSPLVKSAMSSQPFEETSRLRHCPPPVAGLPSVSIASASVVESAS